MEQKGIFKLKNLKILTISIIVLDFVIAILSPIMARYGYSSIAKSLLIFLYNILIPITGFLMIITFIYNMKKSYTEKRTEKQELIVKQIFWGRMALLALSVVIMFAYTFFKQLDLLGIVIMFLLFILSILFGPLFGKLIIRK